MAASAPVAAVARVVPRLPLISLALVGALAVLAAPGATLGSAALTPAEARGKQIYTRGTSSSGEALTAVLGEDGAEIAAATLPCAGCHGGDGRGGREGGVRPSDLTWDALGRAGGGEVGGRRYLPYDDRLLVRAIALGIDSAGNRLHVAMPRYRLPRQAAGDLLAYLRRLGHEDDPGLTADEVHLGVLLPGGASQETRAEAEAVRAVLTARFAALDRAGGGLFGRRLKLHFAQLVDPPGPPAPPAARAARLREILDREPLFALLGAHLAGAEAEMAAVVAEAAVPLVGPLTPRPRQDFPLNRYVFYLTAGLAEQANALVEFAARRLPRGGGGPLVIVAPATGEAAAVAAAVASGARGRGFAGVETVAAVAAAEPAAELAGRLARGGAAALLLLDSGRGAQELLRQAPRLGWRPLVLLPGSLPGDDPFTGVPPALADRLLISLPLLPPDRTPAAAGDYRHLAAAHPLPTHHLAAQMTALASAEVLIEGLKRVGRELSREKLVTALENLYRFDAGLGAPVSFGPNRRVGARGAYVASLDFARHTLGRQAAWIELEP